MLAELLVQKAADPDEVCGASPDFICDWVYDITENQRTAEAIDWVIERPLKAAVILLIAVVANQLVRRAINRAVERMVRDREEKLRDRTVDEVEDGRFATFHHRARDKALMFGQSTERSKQRARTLGTVLQSVASVVIFGLAILVVLGEFDINLGPLIVGASVVGIALGFGAQTIVRDFLAGIFMIIEDEYGVGDIVDLGDATGIVEEVSLRTTRIRDVEGIVWFFPNGGVQRVGNKSLLWARCVLDIDVAYDTDIERATQIIKGAADSVWHEHIADATVLEEPEVWGVQHLGENAIAIRLVVKTEPGEQSATSRHIRQRVKEAFDREGIVIPFPQRVIWIREEEAEPSAGPPVRGVLPLRPPPTN